MVNVLIKPPKGNIKAVVPMHTFGLPIHIDELIACL